MTMNHARPIEFRPLGFRPDGFLPPQRPGYRVITQPTADIGSPQTHLAHLVPGTTQYLLTGAPNTTRWVFVRAVSACAIHDDEPVRPKLRRVAFDALGALILDVPNAPIGLRLTPGPGGLVTAHWAYNRSGQMVPPESFNIYTTTGATPFDFNTPAGNVKPSQGNSFGATFAHGTLARFVVRAVSAAGGEEPNTDEQSVAADAMAPTAPNDLVVEIIP